jgi:hypothetical protein
MNNRRKSRVESKSRTSGRIVSFIVHAILLLVLFLPIFAMKPPEEPTKEALVIQFDYPYNEYVKPEIEKFEQEENTDLASKMSGSEAGGSAANEEPQHSRPQQAAPSRLASPSMTAMSTPQTSSALRTNIGEIPLPTPKIVTHQSWQSVSDNSTYGSDGVEEMKMIDWSDGGFGDIPGSGLGDGDDDSHVSSEGFGTKPGGAGGQGGGTGSTNGTGSGPGGGTGAGGAGDKTGVGQDGNGLVWGVGGDGGFLDRKLVRRANVESLAVKEGRVSFFICVDRSGMVISTKYDLAGSTLKDPAFVAKAEACASTYIFARDDDAPEKQCGKLSFIFKIK